MLKNLLKIKNTPSPNDCNQSQSIQNIQQEFSDFLYQHQVNSFQTRNIKVFQTDPDSNLNTVQLESNHDLDQDQLKSFSTRLQNQFENFHQHHFDNILDQQALVCEIAQITRNRLDLFFITLQMQYRVSDNLPFLKIIIDSLPSSTHLQLFQMLIDLANSHIKLQTFAHVMQKHNLQTEEVYNLHYVISNLNPDLLSLVGHNPLIFKLGHSQLIHFVRLLNNDFWIAQSLLMFSSKLRDCPDSFQAYIKLVSNPYNRHPLSIKFINQVFSSIQKPFANTRLISDIISQQQHIDLTYYLSYFNRYSESQVTRFRHFLSKLNIMQRFQLECKLIFRQPNSINQILDAQI